MAESINASRWASLDEDGECILPLGRLRAHHRRIGEVLAKLEADTPQARVQGEIGRTNGQHADNQ